MVLKVNILYFFWAGIWTLTLTLKLTPLIYHGIQKIYKKAIKLYNIQYHHGVLLTFWKILPLVLSLIWPLVENVCRKYRTYKIDINITSFL